MFPVENRGPTGSCERGARQKSGTEWALGAGVEGERGRDMVGSAPSFRARVPHPQGLAHSPGSGVHPPAPSGLTWNSRGICGSSAPGSHQLPSDAMPARVSNVKRSVDRAARRSPHPKDEGSLLRHKHSLLQARESGDLAVRRSPGPGQRGSRQPGYGAEAPRTGRQESVSQHVRGLQRLHLAHLLGVGRGWARERDPDSEGPAWRPRTRKKRGEAGRGEKPREEAPGRLQPRRSKSRRTAVGTERKGASKGVGLPRPPPRPPERNKGKRGPSRKTGAGRCPPDPRARGGLDAAGLWTAAEGLTLLGEGETAAQGGRRRPGRTARPVPGLKHNRLGQSPKSQVDSVEQPRSVSSASGGEASSPAPPCPPRDRSRWQKELESVFEALFTVNRRLKRELSLHLRPSPGGELGLPELPGRRGETWRDKAAEAEMEMAPAGEATGAAGVDARHSAPRTHLQKLLRPLEDQPGRRLVEPPLQDEQSLSCSEVGTLTSEESPHWYVADSRHQLPRLDTLSLRLGRREQADRAGSAPSRLKQSVERGRLTPLELPEPPEGSLEALSQTRSQTLSRTERGDDRWEPTRAYSAPSKVLSSWGQGKEGGRVARPVSPQGASSTDDDDSDHSQMICDLEKQILQQNKLHKQFLEEARKRLQEFQSVC